MDKTHIEFKGKNSDFLFQNNIMGIRYKVKYFL